MVITHFMIFNLTCDCSRTCKSQHDQPTQLRLFIVLKIVEMFQIQSCRVFHSQWFCWEARGSADWFAVAHMCNGTKQVYMKPHQPPQKTTELILTKKEPVYVFYLLALFFFKVILNCNTVYSYDQFSRNMFYISKIGFTWNMRSYVTMQAFFLLEAQTKITTPFRVPLLTHQWRV